MNARALYLKDGTPAISALCGKCARVWESLDSAERCCTCSHCGAFCDWSDGVSHAECNARHSRERELEVLAAAELVADYSGPFIFDDSFYFDVPQLLAQRDPQTLPDEGFCSEFTPARLDLADILDDLASNHHQDFEAAGVEELEEAVAAFNKENADNGTWWENRERKWSKALILSTEDAPLGPGETESTK